MGNMKYECNQLSGSLCNMYLNLRWMWFSWAKVIILPVGSSHFPSMWRFGSWFLVAWPRIGVSTCWWTGQ